MKIIQYLSIFLVLSFVCCAQTQQTGIDRSKVKEDLDEIIEDLSNNYIYLKDKNVDLECIRSNYEKKINNIETKEDIVLLFEYLLDEFYDSHLILNTNINSSYRLYAPIYADTKNGKTIIINVWQSQITGLEKNIVGGEILKFNQIGFSKMIDDFPTSCNDKDSDEVRTWIGNKVLSGRYNEPRVLTIKMPNNEITEVDLDEISIKKETTLLESGTENNIGIIRINNSLGNNDLIPAFDKALDNLMDTEGLILDLRNTVDGGNTYLARGIFSRFIKEEKPYQKHWTKEKNLLGESVERSWEEMVSPRLKRYDKPLVVLVGRWTGSMGEGIAIGFEGMERAEVVGSEMERLAGAMNGFSFKHLNFGYRISTEKLFHVNGTPREKYVPPNYVTQTTIVKDEIFEKGIALIEKLIF